MSRSRLCVSVAQRAQYYVILLGDLAVAVQFSFFFRRSSNIDNDCDAYIAYSNDRD